MAYGCAATSAFISIHNMAAWMIDRFGSADLKSRYLPALVGMEQLALLPDRAGQRVGRCRAVDHGAAGWR
jgi:alkylation response protein AidB-like acyl-CoA dehydrogenase